MLDTVQGMYFKLWYSYTLQSSIGIPGDLNTNAQLLWFTAVLVPNVN